MVTLALPVGAHPACAPPEYLPIVDAAYAEPGGDESHWMREHLCVGCPVRLECLLLGNARGEPGVWGGLNSRDRTLAGGRRVLTAGHGPRNLVGIDHGLDHRSDRGVA